MTVLHNSTRFHENRLRTFRVILFTGRQTDKHQDTTDYIVSVYEVIRWKWIILICKRLAKRKWGLIPEMRWWISEWSIFIFQRGADWRSNKGDDRDAVSILPGGWREVKLKTGWEYFGCDNLWWWRLIELVAYRNFQFWVWSNEVRLFILVMAVRKQVLNLSLRFEPT